MAPPVSEVTKVQETDKAEDAASKPAKGRRTTKKAPAAKVVPVKAAAKGRSRKKKAGEPDIAVGPVVEDADVDSPRVRIGDDDEVGKVRIADEIPVTKSGDRHLATDEPVDPETVRKVNVVRDLDHIPEEE